MSDKQIEIEEKNATVFYRLWQILFFSALLSGVAVMLRPIKKVNSPRESAKNKIAQQMSGNVDIQDLIFNLEKAIVPYSTDSMYIKNFTNVNRDLSH